MFWLVGGVMSIIFVAAFYAMLCITRYKNNEKTLREQLAVYIQQNQSAQEQLKHAERQFAEKIEAETKCQMLETQGREQAKAWEALRREYIELQNAKAASDTETARVTERLKAKEAEWQSFEKIKEESFKTAKEAMFETGGKVFREEAEQFFLKTQKGFVAINENIAGLKTQLDQNVERTENVWRALLSPGGAGSLSEIALEGTLKNFGLIPDQDFWTQFHIPKSLENSARRPDAIVRLPHNKIVVIDSKASKFFMEIASADNDESEKQQSEKLLKSMQTHIKGLAGKEYKEAIRRYVKDLKIQGEISEVIVLMFVQSEVALEKLIALDPTLVMKAKEEEIFLVGPSSLQAILSSLQHVIFSHQQQQEYQKILQEIGNFLGLLAKLAEHAEKIRKHMKGSAEHFQNFSRQMNRLLRSAEKLQKLGIQLPANKRLPTLLPSLHISEDMHFLVEGELQEVGDEANEEVA